MPCHCFVLYCIALHCIGYSGSHSRSHTHSPSRSLSLPGCIHSHVQGYVIMACVLCALLPPLFVVSLLIPLPLPQKKKRIIDEPTAKKIQLKLKAACIGSTPQKVFSRYDKDRGGTLDAAEFKRMVRVGMKVSFSAVIISTPPLRSSRSYL